jgi:ABC-2 type transport system permease protein
MRRVWAICRKELQMYFYSPVAYVAFAFFFLITGYFFSVDFLSSQVVDVRPLYGNMMLVFLFVIPLLTMRLVSDELRQGTDELLFTSPASIGEIIIGKYLATIVVMLLLTVCTLLYPLILSKYGTLDQPVLWLSVLSIFLLGAAMMAVGLFASSLTAHQMVSGIVGFVLILLLWLVDWLGESVFGKAKEWISLFSIVSRTNNFQKGIFDIAALVFYITFILMFVVLSINVLERKRWR